MGVLSEESLKFIEELFASEYRKMLASAKKRLRDLQCAEDIVHDAYTVAIMRVDELMTNPNPNAWLYVVLRNKIMHEYRNRTRFAAVLVKLEAEAAEKERENEEAWNKYDETWEEILEDLPSRDYELLKLIYVDGYSNREVAEMKGITYDACRKAVQRAKAKIRVKRKE